MGPDIAQPNILKQNVSLLGVHGPVGRGTRHPEKAQPVGSVFAVEDERRPFISVESATQIRGIQFWYPKQTRTDAAGIIANAGAPLKDIHPVIIEGKGHTSISNVECFSANNPALTTVGKSHDFLLAESGYVGGDGPVALLQDTDHAAG